MSCHYLFVFLSIAIFSTASANHWKRYDVNGQVKWMLQRMPGLDKQETPTGDEYMRKLREVLELASKNKDIAEMMKEADDEPVAFDMTSRFTGTTLPCAVEPSTSTPTSVHRLRPADIKVIGAIGDSLSAGNGIDAKTVLGLLTEYRGRSFTAGGQDSLTAHVTLPNLLKGFNDRLFGYSKGPGNIHNSKAYFNLAEPGSKSIDIELQAQRLVDRIKASKEVDFERDWKMITVFVGANDLCDYCKDKKKFSPESYKQHLQNAIDILHKQLPRTFVNLLEVLNVPLVSELQKASSVCSFLQRVLLCTCPSGANTPEKEKEVQYMFRAYQQAVRDLADSGRYDTHQNFTVVVQPFFRNAEPERKPDGKYDESIFAPDCFHFNRLGHSYAATALWNNMLEPYGEKSTPATMTEFKQQGILCPTKDKPYLATKFNKFL